MILHLGSGPPVVLEPGQLLSVLSAAEITMRGLMLTLLTGIVTLPGGADTVFTRVAACDTPPRFWATCCTGAWAAIICVVCS